jgi:hypothetical protein
MKREIVTFLALGGCALLLLSACGTAPGEQETSPNDGSAEAEREAPPRLPDATLVVSSELQGLPARSAAWVTYAGVIRDDMARFYQSNPRSAVYERPLKVEVEARRRMLETWRQLREQRIESDVDYLDDLARVEDAGYLREYVYVLVSQDHWKEPGDLDRSGFQAWRERELPDHAAQTYGNVLLSGDNR